jgi:hypothetical protein
VKVTLTMPEFAIALEAFAYAREHGYSPEPKWDGVGMVDLESVIEAFVLVAKQEFFDHLVSGEQQ